MKDPRQKALASLAKDYRSARLGKRLPEGQRPKLTVTIGDAVIEHEPTLEIGDAEILPDEEPDDDEDD